MMGTQEDCPGDESVDAFLRLILDEDDCRRCHKDKQWVNSDRCGLVEVVKW